MTYLQYIGLFATGSAALIAGIVFIVKQYTENLFKKQLELHKSTLEHESKIKQQEHQIRFSRLDEDRANALKEIHASIVKLTFQIAMVYYTTSPDELAKWGLEYDLYYVQSNFLRIERSILLESKLNTTVNEVFTSLNNLYSDVLKFKDAEASHTKPANYEAKRQDLLARIENGYAPSLNDLQKAFSDILQRTVPN